MLQQRLSLALSCTLLAVLVASTAPLAAGLHGGHGHISGKVIGANDMPIGDVRITITTKANSKFKVELKSAKDGTFATFLAEATQWNDPQSLYHFQLAKSGFVTAEVDKRVPIWMPDDPLGGPDRDTPSMSVLTIRLLAKAPSPTNGR
jgi:hypothetical protein